MSNLKGGLRVRHVPEPEPQSREARDADANYGNRKKIFEKLPPPKKQQQPRNADKPPQRDQDLGSKREYEMLVQNLKKKTMQLELRDSMIGSLNRQLDEAKRQLRIKDMQISKLKQEVQELQRYNSINKDKQPVFSGLPQQEPAFRSTVIQQEKPWSIQKQHHGMGQSFTHGDISVMNINKPNYPPPSQQQEEVEILSPFMALSNHRREAAGTDTFSSQVTIKNHEREPEIPQATTATSLVNPFQKQKNFTDYGNFYKAKENQEFNFNTQRQKRYSFAEEAGKQSFTPPIPSGYSLPSAQQKPPAEERGLQAQHHTFGGDSVSRQLQKFNIFGQSPSPQLNPTASRVSNNPTPHSQKGPSQKGMSIDHSRQFNFSDLDNSDMRGYGSSSFVP